MSSPSLGMSAELSKALAHVQATKMYVMKRNGKKEPVYFDKITTRIASMCDLEPALSSAVDCIEVAQKVVSGVFPGVKTTELDTLAAETAAYMSVSHPDYARLASRIEVSNLHKQTSNSFAATVDQLARYVNPRTGELAPLIAKDVAEIVQANAERLDAAIQYHRDYEYDYFGFKTLERSYLLKCKGKIVERPQHMLMRVAVGIHKEDIDAAIETYDLLSQRWFIHATPTLFNAGTPTPQMSSCFLVAMEDDSIEGIYSTLRKCALISKSAGGIGVSVHNIRASKSYIRGTNGTSNGLVPMLRVYNDTARYVDQGGGKRKGAFAVYLEPWHADIFDFLDLKKNHGKEEQRARDLFYGLWVPDLFMKRVEADQHWSLFCPNECRGLFESYGDKFEQLYEKYEEEGRARKTIRAQELWTKIVESQIETGTPYMMYKDAANAKSNQKNLGTIRSSNLCTEIIEYTEPGEIAVCNLASIALPKFVIDGKFNHEKLYEIAQVATKNLNKIIDRNYYPVPEAKKSNMRHRPIGLGVQGLADVFIMLRLPFECEQARQLNKEIFETIYFAALSASADLAEKNGFYETFPGSPASKGILQFDMWGVKPESEKTGRWDWSIEPYTSNIYTRRVLAGEFAVVNKHLLTDLLEMNLWTPEIKNEIISRKGSVQGIPEIPKDLQELYKTVWEVKQRSLIDMAADRGVYVDQSQSFNVHMENASFGKLTSMHFHSWKKGLKTGMYYLRTRAATNAIQFTVDQQDLARRRKVEADKKDKAVQEEEEAMVCRMEEGCISCGS